MNHHVNRRLDDLLGILLTIEEDIFHDRMRKEVKGINVLNLSI